MSRETYQIADFVPSTVSVVFLRDIISCTDPKKVLGDLLRIYLFAVIQYVTKSRDTFLYFFKRDARITLTLKVRWNIGAG